MRATLLRGSNAVLLALLVGCAASAPAVGPDPLAPDPRDVSREGDAEGPKTDESTEPRFWTQVAYTDGLADHLAGTPSTISVFREAGVGADRSLRLEYFFYTDSVSKAGALAGALRELSYEVDTGPAAGAPEFQVVTGWTVAMHMDETIVMDWTRHMCALGFEHDCEFDGWGADLNQ